MSGTQWYLISYINFNPNNKIIESIFENFLEWSQE